MNKPRAADDFDFIRSRLEQLKKEKPQEGVSESPKDHPGHDPQDQAYYEGDPYYGCGYDPFLFEKGPYLWHRGK